MKDVVKPGRTAAIVAVVLAVVVAVIVVARLVVPGPGQGDEIGQEPPVPTAAPGPGHAPGVSSDVWGRKVTTPEGDIADPLGEASASDDLKRR